MVSSLEEEIGALKEQTMPQEGDLSVYPPPFPLTKTRSKIHRGKTKLMRVNQSNNNPISLSETSPQEVDYILR